MPDIISGHPARARAPILTAMRTSEVQLAHVDEIDVAPEAWTVPGARMKAGRDHQVPLCARAVEILDRGAASAVATAVAVPRTESRQADVESDVLKAARRVTTVSLTSHGFRSSFRDWSAERTNIPRDVCEAALAHSAEGQDRSGLQAHGPVRQAPRTDGSVGALRDEHARAVVGHPGLGRRMTLRLRPLVRPGGQYTDLGAPRIISSKERQSFGKSGE